MVRCVRRLLIALSAALLVAPPVGAQSAPRSVGEEKVEVGLHLLDVMVLDRDGRPVRGLKKGDFKVEVDGEKREIASVDAAAAPGLAATEAVKAAPLGAPAATAPADAASRDGRWIVILFDADRISPEYRDLALRSARTILRTQARPQDRYALAILRSGDLSFVQSFMAASDIPDAILSDPGQILGRIPSLSQRMTELMDNVTGCRESGDPASCVANGTAEFVQLSRQESRAAVNALRDLIASMAPLPGRKALVLYSDGFMLTPGQVAIAAANRISDSAAATLYSRLLDPPSWDYENLMAEASRARVSVFTLRTGTTLGMMMNSAEGRWNATDKDRQSWNPFVTAGQITDTSMRQVAEATGGRTVTATASPDALPLVVEQLDGIYTLGVPIVAGDTIRSKVKVNVAGKGYKVVAPNRLAYRSKPPAGVAGRIAVTLAADGRTASSAMLELDTSQLMVWKNPEGGEDESRIALYYRIFNPSGVQVFDDYMLLRIPRRPGLPSLFHHPLRLAVGEGSYTVAASVSDLVGHGRSTFTAPVLLGSGS